MELTSERHGDTKGVVDSIVRPSGTWELREAAFDTSVNKIVAAIEAGLGYGELEALREHYDLPMDRMATLLGIPKATLHRRKVEGRLNMEESDRVVRFARILRRASEALETEDNARQWLAARQYGLGGAIPLEFARTERGAREVEDLLTRIEHGVYS